MLSDPQRPLADTTNQPRRRRRGRPFRRPNIVTLTHHIFSKGEWRRARLADHPRAKLTLIPERNQSTPTCIDGLADSGAQSNVWSLREYIAAGHKVKDLSKVNLSLNAANKSAIRIDGAFFADITGVTAEGTTIVAKAMVYVSRDVNGFYLSYSTMIDLGMLAKSFPTPGCALPASQPSVAHIREITSDCPPPCGNCRGRASIPKRPTELPFECTPDNIKKMKEYLLDKYSAVFNT